MNRNILVRNALAAAGQTLVQTAVLLVVYRYLVGRLGIDQVGVWAVVLATASAARISELGLAGSVTKFVASYRAAGDDEAAGEIVQTAALTVAAALGAILFVLYPVLFQWMPQILPANAVMDGRAILPYALASMWLGTVSAIWLSGLDGCLRSDVRAGLVVLSTAAFFILVVATVPTHGLIGLASAQVGQGIVLTVAGWIALKRVMARLPALPTDWRRSRFREMLHYGVNVQIISIVMLLFEPTTKVLFARYGGLSAAGYFELAQQLVMRMRGLIVESNRVVVPILAGMEQLGREARRLYAKNFSYLLFLLTPLFAILASIIPAISEGWLGTYQPQFVVMGCSLTAAWYLNSVTAPAYFAYMGQGRLRWLTASHLILGSSNVLLGIVLGPIFGWQGVLGAFVLSLAVGSSIPVWTYNREQQLSLRAILSRADVWLVAICAGAAAAAIAGYSSAVRAETSLWTRLAIPAAASVVMVAAAWRHPLAPEVVSLVRQGFRRPDESR